MQEQLPPAAWAKLFLCSCTLLYTAVCRPNRSKYEFEADVRSMLEVAAVLLICCITVYS